MRFPLHDTYGFCDSDFRNFCGKFRDAANAAFRPRGSYKKLSTRNHSFVMEISFEPPPLTLHIKYDILRAVNTKAEIETFSDTGTNALHRAMMEAKERSGLSQKEIAARSGMAQPNISRIEHGGAVSFNAFSEYISTCGFDFTVNLRPVGNGAQRKCF